MTIVRTEAMYLGRQFTVADAQAGYNTDGRVIIYDNFPKFHACAWDDAGSGEDIWFEVIIYDKVGIAPPFVYNNVIQYDSRDNPEYFYDKQYWKSGELCTFDLSLNAIAANNLLTYGVSGDTFAIMWIAYDRTSGTPLPLFSAVEFTYITESRLLRLSDLDITSFDRATIFRPYPGTDPVQFYEVEAPLIPTSAHFREPFESAARTLSLSFTDPEGIYLPQSNDSINYFGVAPPAGVGVYAPVFRLGNRVAYEHSLSYGITTFPWTALVTYADQSRYRGRIYTLPGVLRKEPWVRQHINIQRSFDGLPWGPGKAWEDVQEGDEYDLWQSGAFFRESQIALGVTDVRANGSYHQCQWDFTGMYYMTAPTYKNTPGAGQIVSVDCQDRLSRLDSNGRVVLATTEILEEADLQTHRLRSYSSSGGFPNMYWDNIINDPPYSGYLKTWQDPNLPTGLLLWFYDLNGPYAGNYTGTDPIADGSAAIWVDEFEIFIEYLNPFSVTFWQLDEDAYERTLYGLLINKDWSADLPWQNQHMRLTFQTIIPDSNPVNEIIEKILEYPNYNAIDSEYGGPGLVSADYSIPGIDGVPLDDWMDLDVNRFVWNHYMGSAFDAIKELMRIAQFPYNYRVTAEPNPGWAATPFDPTLEDIITFREVTQEDMVDVEMMVMLDINIQQKIDEDREATIVRTRVFDAFAQNELSKLGGIARVMWGPGNSAGLGLEYEGGFNHNPNTAPTSSMIELRREKLPFWNSLDPAEDPNTGDISNSWRIPYPNNTARGVLTDNDPFTHLRWLNDSKDWGEWPDFIPTPVVEVAFSNLQSINLAALDIRNGEWYDVTNYSDWSTSQHIGIKYGSLADRVFIAGLSVLGNIITGVPVGTFPVDHILRFNQATVEVTGCPIGNDLGNTYPVIANVDAAGTITVDVQDAYFAGPLATMQGQLGNPAPGTVSIIVRNYKWLPNFNRVLHEPQETISWETDGYPLRDVSYFEIWCFKPAVTSKLLGGGPSYNDQFFDVGSIWAYGEGATIGESVFQRIRDTKAQVPNESEDLIDDNDEFWREDLISRMGIRTQVLPDDKALQTFDLAFERAAQALYENLVNEDSYDIDGVYYPFLPRYSTVLLNIASMRIAFPALLESRNFTFAGVDRKYKLTLRNYNNSIWPHPYTPDYGVSEPPFIPWEPGG